MSLQFGVSLWMFLMGSGGGHGPPSGELLTDDAGTNFLTDDAGTSNLTTD
jgi:hypothetical protein